MNFAKEMELINLNQVRKIYFHKKEVTTKYVWKMGKKQTLIQWFGNLFRKKNDKKYTKRRYIRYMPFYNGQIWEKAEDFNKENKLYLASDTSDIIFKRPYIVMIDDTDEHFRIFDTNKEAMDFFQKLQSYIHENNIPFIDLYVGEE